VSVNFSIIAKIHDRGGSVDLRDGKLILRRGNLTDAAVEWIKVHRADLIREMVPPHLADEFEERAAIREYDGGQYRAKAEAAAACEMRARMRA